MDPGLHPGVRSDSGLILARFGRLYLRFFRAAVRFRFKVQLQGLTAYVADLHQPKERCAVRAPKGIFFGLGEC